MLIDSLSNYTIVRQLFAHPLIVHPIHPRKFIAINATIPKGKCSIILGYNFKCNFSIYIRLACNPRCHYLLRIVRQPYCVLPPKFKNPQPCDDWVENQIHKTLRCHAMRKVVEAIEAEVALATSPPLHRLWRLHCWRVVCGVHEQV